MPTTSRNSVAFQGELGAFSFSAARKLLGDRVQTVPQESFDNVFKAVQSGRVSHAVIPIENTLHGSIHENYDHLLEYGLSITGETNLRISHQLIALPGTRLRDIRRAFSHPVALNQCRLFFKKHPRIEPLSFYDTAGSVKMLTEQRPEAAAAIASEAAAEIYNAVILKRNIEDNRRNFTRFFLLTKQARRTKGADRNSKTSIVFSTPNVAGALFKVMACFALRDISLSKIESRPLRARPWEYMFYVDFAGSLEDDRVRRALENLGEITSFLKILGDYCPTP